MSWLTRYRRRAFVNRSLWLAPLGAALATMVVANVLRWLDAKYAWTGFGYTSDGARMLVSSLAGSMLTFLVFVQSSLLLVLQFASAQLTPRAVAMIGTTINARALTCVLLSSFVLCLTLSARIENDWVPQVSVAFSTVYCVFAIAYFIYFVQVFSESLRPAIVLQRIVERGRLAVGELYPKPFDAGAPAREAQRLAQPPELDPANARTILHDGRSGVLLAFGETDLVESARRAGVVVELLSQVGDFISVGDPLFRVYPANGAIEDKILRHSIAVGAERTLEQDPAFALRMMVDIASRALSPAINDPTTAVLAIDQIHRMLLIVGLRHLDVGRVRDRDGKLRFVFRAPRWEDLVGLATNEIRLYGSSSLQVPRRLKAMLTHLIELLPAPRVPALRRELEAVREAVGRSFESVDDRRNAEIGDLQGVGGAGDSDTQESSTR